MAPKAKDSKPQDPAEKNLKTIQFLQESELSKHPVIGGLLSRAIATGDFIELEHYMSLNHVRVEAFSRMALLEAHRQKKNPFYPFPSGDELVSLQGLIKLGIINRYKGQDIFFGISPQDLTNHASVIGRSGVGKTIFMMNCISELIKCCNGYNVLIFDVKGSYRRQIGIVPDLFNIPFHKFVFNPLNFESWMDPKDFIFLFSKIFTRENLLSIPSENLISTALHRLFSEKGVFRSSKNFPNMQDLYNTIKNMEADKTFGYRYRDIFENVLNRLAPYVSLSNFSNIKGISIDTFINHNLILELPLIKIPDYVHNFVISWISNSIYYRNMTSGLRGNTLQTLIIIDEARTIIAANRESSSLEFIESGFNEIITKGREFGIGLWLISQESASFSQVYRSNSILKVAFQLLDGEDVSEIKRSFGLSDAQIEYYYKLPAQRVAVCRYGKFERPFLLGVQEVTGLDHVPDDREIDEAMKDFYAEILPKEDKEINVHYEEPYHRLSNSEIDAILMVRHLITTPFLNYKELINVLHLTPARGDQARAWLINSGYAKPHSIVLRRGKPGDYYELTEKAYKQFGGRPPIGHGSFRHKLFCFSIKTSVEDQGWSARVEGIMQGTTAKAIDVLAWKKGDGMIGYEVTLHFPNLIHNLNEDLRTTLKKVVVVCSNKDELAKAQKIVRESSVPTDRLEFKTIFDFTQK